MPSLNAQRIPVLLPVLGLRQAAFLRTMLERKRQLTLVAGVQRFSFKTRGDQHLTCSAQKSAEPHFFRNGVRSVMAVRDPRAAYETLGSGLILAFSCSDKKKPPSNEWTGVLEPTSFGAVFGADGPAPPVV